MRLYPRPALTEDQLQKLEQRATPMAESTRHLFERYRACASDVRKAIREGDNDAYKETTKRLEGLRYQIEWIVTEPSRPLSKRSTEPTWE